LDVVVSAGNIKGKFLIFFYFIRGQESGHIFLKGYYMPSIFEVYGSLRKK